jgi:phage baseplate assembly protein gpV
VPEELQQGPVDIQFKVAVNGNPLDPKYRNELAEVVVELDSTRPAMATVQFRDTMFEGGKPDDDILKKLGWSLAQSLEISEVASSKPIFKGEISALEFVATEHGRHAVVRAYDRLHRLHRGRKTQVFKNMTDSDIASQLAGDGGMVAGKVDTTSVVHAHMPQANQTDYEFLRWRAEENGYELTVSDSNKLNFCKPSNTAGPTLKLGEHFRVFRPRIMAPLHDKVEVTGWDAQNSKVLDQTVAIANTKSADVNASLTPAGLAGKFGSKNGVAVARPTFQQGDVDTLAKTLAERYSQTFADAEATVHGDPALVPGTVVKVDGAGSTFSGHYRITSARHVLNIHGYYTHLVFSGLNDRSALALSSDGLASTPKYPRMHGLVTGLVTQTAKDGADPAPPDKSHIKIKFDWLKDTKGNPYETDWVRTVQVGGGKGFGTLVLPEVGDEVLVGFEHGDLRRPYVIGGVYNHDNKASDHKLVGDLIDGGGKIQRRGFSSRTHHRLAFDDANSKADGITLVTGDDNLTIVLDKKNTKITIDAKNGKIEIHGQQDISIKNDKGDISLEAQSGNINMKAAQNVKIEASKDLAFSAQMNAKMSANVNLDLTSQANAKLANASGKVELMPGIGNFKSPLINIGP